MEKLTNSKVKPKARIPVGLLKSSSDASVRYFIWERVDRLETTDTESELRPLCKGMQFLVNNYNYEINRVKDHIL